MRLTFRPGRALASDAARTARCGSTSAATAGSAPAGATRSGAAGDSIGRHLEGSFTWAAIPDRLSIETGFEHLWAGRFAEQTAGAAFRGDPQYFYSAVTHDVLSDSLAAAA